MAEENSAQISSSPSERENGPPSGEEQVELHSAEEPPTPPEPRNSEKPLQPRVPTNLAHVFRPNLVKVTGPLVKAPTSNSGGPLSHAPVLAPHVLAPHQEHEEVLMKSSPGDAAGAASNNMAPWSNKAVMSSTYRAALANFRNGRQSVPGPPAAFSLDKRIVLGQPNTSNTRITQSVHPGRRGMLGEQQVAGFYTPAPKMRERVLERRGFRYYGRRAGRTILIVYRWLFSHDEDGGPRIVLS